MSGKDTSNRRSSLGKPGGFPIDAEVGADAAKPKRITPKKTPSKPGAKPARKVGRPPEPVPANLKDEICEWIAAGKTLRDYCRQEGKPHWRTVYDWLEKDEAFAARFGRARERGEEAIAQECMAIADDATNDWMEKLGEDGQPTGWRLNGEHVQRSKLRIETRLKLLAKWNPKKWGEKVDVNHGNQPENPLTVLLKQVAGSALPVVKDAQGDD